MAKKNLFVEIAIASRRRIVILATDKHEMKQNIRSLNTWVGAFGIIVLAVFTDNIHGSIGDFGTFEQFAKHVSIFVLEIFLYCYSMYLLVKKPIPKDEF